MTLEQLLLEMRQTTVQVGRTREMSLYDLVQLGAQRLDSAVDALNASHDHDAELMCQDLDLELPEYDEEDEDDNLASIFKNAVREAREETEALKQIFTEP